MKRVIGALIAVVLTSFLIYGVLRQHKTVPEEKPGKVTATRDYENYFGPPPAVPKGDANAFVIYFPSAESPGKLTPFPFFSFDMESLKKVAIERLLAGMDAGPYRGKYPAAPAGVRLVSLNDEQGKVTAVFSDDLYGKEGALPHAVAVTLRQFEGVREVIVRTEDGTTFDSSDHKAAVADLAAPRLLNVVAMKEKGEKHVNEVDVFFDRPVDFRSIVLTDTTGRKLEGEIYHSIFDMAAVLKPKDPGIFTKGMRIKITYHVVDKKGRSAEGSQELELDIKEH